MATVSQVLATKENNVLTIHPDKTVYDAIQLMANNDIGSLVVVEDDKPVGIFTERHYARDVLLEGRHSPTTPIREVMQKRIAYAVPNQSIDECLAVMTDKRIRHLPVLDQGNLVGIISIGDLVKHRIADQEFTIEQLEQYIHS